MLVKNRWNSHDNFKFKKSSQSQSYWWILHNKDEMAVFLSWSLWSKPLINLQSAVSAKHYGQTMFCFLLQLSFRIIFQVFKIFHHCATNAKKWWCNIFNNRKQDLLKAPQSWSYLLARWNYQIPVFITWIGNSTILGLDTN